LCLPKKKFKNKFQKKAFSSRIRFHLIWFFHNSFRKSIELSFSANRGPALLGKNLMRL